MSAPVRRDPRAALREVGDTGGHFPFLEDPGRFVASFRSFAALV